MNDHVLYLLIGSALALAPLAAQTQTAAPKTAAVKQAQSLPESVQKALKQGDYVAAEKALIDSLRTLDIKPDAKDALRQAMLLDVIRTTDATVMTTMAKDKDVRRFLNEFCTDFDWQELYLGCGLVPYHTEVGMNVLYRIWKEEKGSVKNKKLAVALASCWGGGETAPEPAVAKCDPGKFNPVWRYKFFQKQQEKGLLQPGYSKLRPWELRFVVSITGQDWDDASYEYLAKNINVPYDQYGESYGVVHYVGRSKFGDSVHNGTYFYQPYPNLSIAEVTMKTGGVCGSQGHLGAVAAMAHGIPAYTCGQPGHCAYGVRFRRNEWVDGNADFESHEPNGVMHNYIFSKQAPTSTHLMETVFGKDSVIDKAYREAFCARALAAVGKTDEALKMWEQALTTSPFHPFFRRDLHKLMKEQGLTPKACYDYLCKVIPLYVTHGFAAADMTEDLADIMQQMDDEQLLHIFDLLHEMMSGSNFHDAVRCDGVLESQDKMLKKEESHLKLLTSVYTRHLSKGDGYAFGQFLEYGVNNYLNKGKEEVFSKAFQAAIASATPNDKTGKPTKPLRKAYTKSILSAEKSHSPKAFIAITQSAERAMGKSNPVALKNMGKIPGTPVTGECLLNTSKSGYYDEPFRHGGVVTPEGGNCFIDSDKAPSVIVELDGGKELTGCIIRKSGNGNDMKKATVAVATDGVNYTPMAQTDNMPEEWVVPFPNGTRAKFVRIEFDNADAPRSAHLSHFLVFKK